MEVYNKFFITMIIASSHLKQLLENCEGYYL